MSVLFADLVRSTELATRLDPEELRDLYAPFFERMAGVIERFGGAVEKFIGDAVVGVFGVPVAHEDDPVRALRAGLAMQSELAAMPSTLASSVGVPLAMRVAVHTGEALATPGAPHEPRVTGETTWIAARLQELAPSGGVVASDRTYQGARDLFEFERMGPHRLKGVAEPVVMHRVVRETGPGRGWLSSPLVGRRDEFDLFRILLRRTARERRAFLATVIGPVGIGKSRLTAEVAQAAETNDPSLSPAYRVISGRCQPYEEGLALSPLGEILKTDVGILDSDPPEAILERARSSLGAREMQGGAAAIATLLASLGIETGSDPLGGADRESAFRMIAEAWRGYLGSLVKDGPVLMVIEDIHWADQGLLDLLEYLTARTHAPVLLLCLARPELFDARPTWGSGLVNTITLELGALAHHEEQMLLANLLGGSLEPSLQQAIGERVAGNPFFAGELVRMLTESGSIRRRKGVWIGASPTPVQLPDTVQAAIAARLDRLELVQKRAIQDASVVGRVFWDGSLKELGSPAEQETIEALIGRGLVRELPSSSIEGSRELQFEHVLIREVAYASIPKSRRPEAHRAVLAWIEKVTRGRDEEFSELMAHHASNAGDAERTARYATLAGHRHRRLFAAEEAIRWYERALAAANELESGDTTVLIAEITLSRGEALEQLGRVDEGRSDYERALATVRSAERGRGWLEARILGAIANLLWIQDRYEEAEAMIPEALAVAKAAGTPDVEARLLYTGGSIAWARGDWERAWSLHQQALGLAEVADDLEAEAYARHGLAQTQWMLGPLEESLGHGERSQELWRSLGQLPMVYRTGQLLGLLHLLLGRLDAAEAIIDETLAGQRGLGQRREEPFTLASRMLVQLSRGDLGAALADVNDAVEIARAVDASGQQLISLVLRMLLFAELDCPGLAARDLRIAEGRLAGIGGGFLRSPLASIRGWLELDGGDREAAVACFARGREEAGDSLFHRLLCARFEIRAWDMADMPSRLSDAATWLLASGVSIGWPSEALAAWALARADAQDGKQISANNRGRTALHLSQEAGDLTMVWRAATMVAETTDDPAEAADLRRRASDIVRGMMASLKDEELKERFLGQPAVVALVGNH
ncbi:MAG: AAA family ATPase [Actinomycetota bacterium]|nr:AAA family ATPase [Actinomycetota bacterium]